MKIAAIAVLIMGIVSAGLSTNYYIQARNLEWEKFSRVMLAFNAVEILSNNPAFGPRPEYFVKDLDANRRAELEESLAKDIREWRELLPRARRYEGLSILFSLGSVGSFAVGTVLLLVLLFFHRKKAVV